MSDVLTQERLTAALKARAEEMGGLISGDTIDVDGYRVAIDKSPVGETLVRITPLPQLLLGWQTSTTGFAIREEQQ